MHTTSKATTVEPVIKIEDKNQVSCK